MDIHKWGFIPVSKISEVICVDLVMIAGPPASCCSKNHLSALSKNFLKVLMSTLLTYNSMSAMSLSAGH